MYKFAPMKSSGRELFGSRFGVLMAMAGSAIGLGNLWRFPYLTARNGGAAFIIIYFVLLLLISIPTMISEYVVGRRSRASIYLAPDRLGYPKWKFIGIPAVIGAVFVIGFYNVVGGWTIKYLISACTFQFSSEAIDYPGQFAEYISSPVLPLIHTLIFIGLIAFISLKGVKKGIERASKAIMPVLLATTVLIAIRSLTLPGSYDGLKYLLVPDFSKVSAGTINDALGQGFFSLGLGIGAILVYGSYVSSDEKIPHTSIYTAILDTVFAIIAGIAIIPAIFAIAYTKGTPPVLDAGPQLVFVTLPSIFASMPLGGVVAILFFLSLTLAALTSALSIFESITAFFMDMPRGNRTKAVCMVFLLCLIPGILCSLSQGLLSDVHICGLNIFDFMDVVSANILMTSTSLILLIFTGWIMKKEEFMDELSNHGTVSTPKWIMNAIYVLTRYVAPLGVIAIFLLWLIL